jgi:hypothetical protein
MLVWRRALPPPAASTADSCELPVGPRLRTGVLTGFTASAILTVVVAGGPVGPRSARGPAPLRGADPCVAPSAVACWATRPMASRQPDARLDHTHPA